MKKILLTLGAMAGAIVPIAGVVACGKEEEKKVTSTIKGSKFKIMFLETNSQGKLEANTDYANFLSKIAKSNGKTGDLEYLIPNKTLKTEEYKNAVNESFQNDKAKIEALMNILKANKNNAILAASCLIFTEQSIKYEETAKIGLVKDATGGAKEEDIKNLNLSIESGNIIAKEIADSIMKKFNTAKNDPMWNDDMLKLNGIVEGNTFKEQPMFSTVSFTMAGRENLKMILTNSGYKYEEAEATTNN